MGFLRSLGEVEDFIKNVTSLASKYKKFEGWKALATSCTVYLLESRIHSNQIETIIPFINKVLGYRSVQLKPYVPPQFSNIQDFESWIKNEKVSVETIEKHIEKDVLLESKLTKIIRKDHLEKADMVCQEYRIVMNNLAQAEQKLFTFATILE